MPTQGEVIGPYTLIRSIGRGAMGDVWLAEKRGGIIVTRLALKLPRKVDIDADRMRAEATHWTKVTGHPNVLPLIDAMEIDEYVVIASEYVEEGSLAGLIRPNGGTPLKPQVAVDICIGVLAGLEHIHKNKVIHRDIKPENILLQHGIPRIADFGIASLRTSESRTTTVAGSVPYMAPEAFEFVRNEKTDLWSTAVVLYLLLSGTFPIVLRDLSDLASCMRAILHEDVVPLSNALGLPEKLRAVVGQALNKDPAKRFSSASQFKERLRDAAGELPKQEITWPLVHPVFPGHGVPTPQSLQPAPVSMPIVVEGTSGELFAAAIGGNKAYRNHFFEAQSDLVSRPLFPDGIISVALRQRSELFQTPESQVSRRHVLVGGPTASGKTFLADALALNVVVEQNRKAIYVAPTRQLAAERHKEMVRRFALKGNPDIRPEDIVLSTGEESQGDWRLHRGRYKIAVFVYEKANLFLRPTFDFVDRLALIIIDELHMIEDPLRGGVLDLLIAKVHRENQSRDDRPDGDLSGFLRLIAMTTDRVADNSGAIAAFSTAAGLGANDVGSPPLLVVSSSRPTTVRHVARVYGASGAGPAIPIATDGAAGVVVPPDSLSAVKAAIRSDIECVESSAPPRGAQSRSLTSLVNVIVEYAESGALHSSVLVAVPSIDALKMLARMLRKRRKEPRCELHRDEAFEGLVGGLASTAAANELIDFARRGVFLHHSELARPLREAVAERFRSRRPRSDGLADVLFATETLFYGVNLTTDCVILSSLMWPREPLDSIDVTDQFLGYNEFQNVLGRAGRPGYCASNEAGAVICIPSWIHQTDPGALNAAIDRYYGGPGSNIRFRSGLFAESDARRLVKGELKNLDDVSFPSFRSTMDALRHVADDGHASTATVKALLRDTILAHSGAIGPEVMDSLIERILELGVEAGLVEKVENRYAVLQEAEALIDTGTRWQSVAPMASWLGKLQQLRKSGAPLPVELLVPAFVSSPDLWKAARMFCYESAMKVQDGIEEAISMNHARKALASELAALGLDAQMIDGVTRLLEELGNTTALPLAVTTYRKAVLFRLVAALLRWLRGAPDEDVRELSMKNPPALDAADRDSTIANEASVFKDRYSDRASWLAVACLRYFSRGGLLLEDHRAALPRLAQRLRLGVRIAALPLIGQPRTRLVRRQACRFIDEGISPTRIILSQSPMTEIPGHLLPEDRTRDLVDDVFGFYLDQTRTLIGVLYDEAFPTDAAEVLESLYLTRDEGGPMANPTEDDFKRFLGALLSLWRANSDLRTLPADSGCGFRLAASGLSDALPVWISGANEPPRDGIVVRLPWSAVQPTTGVQLTALGGIVLGWLVGRKYIQAPARALAEWRSRREGRTVGIRDLLSIDMPTLVSSTREAILTVIEPGVDENG